MSDLFKRLPGASPKLTKPISINGGSHRMVEVPVPHVDSSLAFSLEVNEG